jgi:hypothetical protein
MSAAQRANPFKLDSRVREIFNAHADAVFATSVEESNKAIEKRDRLLWELDAEQRGYVDVIARGFGRAFSMEGDG